MEEVYTQYLPFGKICCTCKEFLLFENFNQSNSTKDGYRKQCQECRRVKDKEARESAKLRPDYDEKRKGVIQCKRCGGWREVKCLRATKSKGSDCFKCNSEKSKAFRAKPEIKAKYIENGQKQAIASGKILRPERHKLIKATRTPRGKKPHCKDCNKVISYGCLRCVKCANKLKTGENNNKWVGGLPKCLDCGKQLSAYETKRCPTCYHLLRRGEKHPNWKGGITSPSKKERAVNETRLWSKNVLRRDKFTCQLCGQVGGKLNAHHKKEWSNYKELRFDIDNGVTLCKECHLHKAHRGAWRNIPTDWDELVKEYVN